MSSPTRGENVLPLPPWHEFVECLIIALSCAVLGLSAYILSRKDGDHGNIFSIIIVSFPLIYTTPYTPLQLINQRQAAITIIITTYILIASSIRGFEEAIHQRNFILTLFVVLAFAWAAQFINLAIHITGTGRCSYINTAVRFCHNLPNLKSKPYYHEMIAESVLGAVIL